MAGPVRISIVADGARARRELEQTASAADRTGSRIGKAFGGAARVAKYGAAGISAAVVGIGASAVKTEADFSQQMNLIGAATGAGAAELGKLRDLAKEMGAQTSFSANEAAGAMLELSKAGLTPATIQAGALEGTLTLAAAGGTDLATAATVASNALNTFGLRGKDMASVAAALAGGANASSASVESLAFGLSQVGPGAKNAGLSLQETVGVLSAFDAAGIKGSDAGTSLKTMLTRLVPSTDKARDAMRELGLDFTNADGSFQSIEQVAGQLQKKMGDLSAEQRTQALATIFGSDATRAASVLIDEGSKGVRKYIKATKDQGAAQGLAKARMAGTTGALERLSGAAETSKLVIGEALAPVVVRVADYLSENLVPATEKAVKWTEDFIGAIQDIRNGDGAGSVGEIGDAVAGINWDKAVKGGKAIASSIAEIGGAVGASGLDVLADTLDVTGVALEYAADNSDKLAAAVPFLAAGFVAFKAAAIAGNIAMAAAIPLRFAEIAATRQQTIAIRAMTAAVAQLTAAQAGAARGAWVNGTWYSAVRNNGQAAGAAATQVSRLGTAARGAAGIAGMGALVASTQTANDKTSALLGTLGGAAVGFSVAGPWGALVGGAAGLAMGVFANKTKDAKDALEEAAPAVTDYTSTLDDLTAATTRATRAQVFKNLTEAGGLKFASELGISARDVVSATLGQEDALRRVNAALQDSTRYQVQYNDGQTGYLFKTFKTQGAVDKFTASLEANGGAIDEVTKLQKDSTAKVELAAFIGRETDAWKANTRAKRQEILASQDLTVLQGKIPKKIITEIGQTGITPTIKGVARVAAQYKLIDKRQIRALIEATGTDLSVRKIRRVTEALIETENQRPNLSPYTREFTTQLNRNKTLVDRSSRDISEKLRDGTRRARADLGPFTTSVRAGTTTATSTAKGGGLSIGVGLGDGVVFGIVSRSGAVQGAIASSVRSAIAAGKAAAKTRSPSRETMWIGDMMGKGLEAGIAGREPAARARGKDVVAALLAGIIDGSNGVTNAVEKVTRFIEQRIDLKDDRKERAREKAVLAGLKNEFAQLKKNGKAQDRNADALVKARDRYRQLADEAKQYAATIKESFVSYGSVISLGQGAGFADSGQLISGLQGRLDAARRFAEVIKQLSGSLNATTLQQLIDAGVEGGLGTAEAILAGGASAIGQINTLTGQIAAAGGGLGDAMKDKFKQAGVDAAAGLVLGLEKEQKRLDKAAERIGATIVRAIKKSLGIKSPSRVFRRVGEDSMAGLAIGLDETYARRLGARVGTGVEQGFKRPTLDTATIAAGPSAVRGGEVIRIELRLSAEEGDRLVRGKTIIADINYARSQGAPAVAR